MGRIQSDLSSGKRVRVASQDPISFQRSRIIEENIRREEQYQSNISSGLRQGRLAQESLDETVDRLIDIKRIMVQGSSDSSDAKVRENMADEVKGIRDSLVQTLNVSYGDRYLFAGTNSAEKPFATDEGSPSGVASQSNSTSPKVMVADGMSLTFSVSGEELMDTHAGDLFQVLHNIEEALRDNDQGSINDQLKDIDSLIEHVTDQTSKLGSNIKRLEHMFEQYESSKIIQESDVSSLVDTDFAQAFSDLQRTQVAYESAMAVHSKMFSNTLLNYL